jgi:hypothetical protein
MELTACEEHLAYTNERLPGQCKGFTFFFFFYSLVFVLVVYK